MAVKQASGSDQRRRAMPARRRIRYWPKGLCQPCCLGRLLRISPSPVMMLPTFTGPRWPPRRRSTREKIPSPWRVLGSRNGVDRGHRRPGDSPPRNRLETPQLVSPAGIPLRHAGCLHSVSSPVLRALGCLIAHAHQVVSFPGIRHTRLWCLSEKAADSWTRHSCLPRFTLLGVRWQAYWTLVQPHAPAVRPRSWE